MTPLSAAAWLAACAAPSGGNGDGEDAEQAVAEVIDRGVGEDALEVLLRGSGPGAHDDSGDGENQKRGADLGDLVAEERKRDAQQAVDAHFGHGAGEQHGDR